MNHSDLKIIQQCDLNLLLSLAVLIEEQSVSKSAERLSISQPAMSQNLKKLRVLFNEPLFVKSGQGIKATEKAVALLPKLREWLQMSSRLILQQPFEPAEIHGVIRIAFMDDLTQKMVPMMIEKLLSDAPHIELEFIHKPKDLFTMLESGELDIAAGGKENPPANIYGRQINTDIYCAAYAKHHPLAQIASPSLQQIFSHNTAEYSASNLVEDEINSLALRHGLTRKVTFSSASMTVMMHGLLAGQHVGFIPQRALNYPDWKHKLNGIALPQLPQLNSTLYWHARVHKDPLIQWFKNSILDMVSNLKAQGTLPKL
ncbi:LysR substrate-binding domain-containing protein [Shewanella waksmanii]|uniref:LysR family transcriptional regulator n=1 Tax=Shewanella waksmanii TaxID=213783 RepID=UPI003735137D